jgi:hypothetical protein
MDDRAYQSGQPRHTARHIALGIAGSIVVCLVLFAFAYSGASLDPRTKGSGEITSLKDQRPTPPGTSGR